MDNIKRGLIKEFPIRRIKPVDGLVVTAEVWDKAHEYQRQHLRFHTLYSHGAGIVAGLEVVASDPPNTSVYILPGIAMDTMGQIIVLPKPVFYDFGQELEGPLYLLLSYGESRPQPDKKRAPDDDNPLLYVHSLFSIIAQPTLPSTPYVELARVRRRNRNDALSNARHPAHPGLNELDLRFRDEVATMAREMVSVGVCYVGAQPDKRYGNGVDCLARALNHTGDYRVAVDDNVPLDSALRRYTLVYVVGRGAVRFNQTEMGSLQNYIRLGGTLLFEGADAEAAAVILDFLKATKLKPAALPRTHRLLTTPFLFAAPPPGFGAGAPPKLLVDGGAILSTYNYGLLWQGERSGGPAAREEIRTALEWGSNVVAYAAERRKSANF